MTKVTDTIRNGVDTEQLFGTLDLLVEQPELAAFQFRAENRSVDGAHNRSTIRGFFAAGQEDASREEAFAADAGEPGILLRHGHAAPNPAEYLLHALAACLTTSLVYVAAARGKVPLTRVESTLEGDMDVQGALGLDDGVPNRFTDIRVTFHRRGRRLRREAARGRPGARGGPLRRVRHGHHRRARPRGRRHPLIGTPTRGRDAPRPGRGRHPQGDSPCRSSSAPGRGPAGRSRRPRRAARQASSPVAAPEHDRDASYPSEGGESPRCNASPTSPPQSPPSSAASASSRLHDLVVAAIAPRPRATRRSRSA